MTRERYSRARAQRTLMSGSRRYAQNGGSYLLAIVLPLPHIEYITDNKASARGRR